MSEAATVLVSPSIDPAGLIAVRASSAEHLVTAVRSATARGVAADVHPDDAVPPLPDGLDEWVALVSVLVAEGAAAITTSYPRRARRVIHTSAAIGLGRTPDATPSIPEGARP